MKTTYIFREGSVSHLNVEVKILARTFKEAKQKLLKILYTGKVVTHIIEIEYDSWGNEII